MASRIAKEFKKLVNQLERLNLNVKEEIKRTLVIEGENILVDAKRLTPVNTGFLRLNWYRNPIIEIGDKIEMEVGNSSDYASFIEFGFRSHWVPGVWQGNQFEYIRGYTDGGMYVGPRNGYVDGKYMLKKASDPSERRIYTRLKNRIDSLGRDLNGS